MNNLSQRLKEAAREIERLDLSDDKKRFLIQLLREAARECVKKNPH